MAAPSGLLVVGRVTTRLLLLWGPLSFAILSY